MALVNPYNDAKELTSWQWMWKYHKRKMIFSFCFISMFIIAPHVGQWRIDEPWLRWLISGSMMVLNVVSTWLQPYTIYRKNLKGWYRWEDNFNKGMYGEKKMGGDI